MIKLIIFDLDGVLVDLRDDHFRALNEALSSIDPKYPITMQEHLSTYDGLPTREKLKKLTALKGLPKNLHEEIWRRKQKNTANIIKKAKQDKRICGILKRLKEEGYILACASNAIRQTVKFALLRKGFLEYMDFLYSNQDVFQTKPNPEMFYRCMIKAGVSAKETLILEDSKVGRKSAISSGAHLLPITNSLGLTYKEIKSSIASAEGVKLSKWIDKKLNILIPIAGAGKRFKEAGYTFPKPLVEVNGKPMIQVVIDNLNIQANYIFVVQKEHYKKYNLKYLLYLIAPNCKIIVIDKMTEGAACTTLLAQKYIDNNNPLLLVNSDQYIEWDSSSFMWSMQGDNVDGGILTFKATHPKWSFARIENNRVVEVAEKKPISDDATVGIYYWKRGKDYVSCAKEMIKKNIRVNDEFYVCPVYNEAIKKGMKIKSYGIKEMWGLGTPEDLERFLKK